MTKTPETDAAWDAVSRMPDGMYDSQVPIRVYASAMSDHSKKMERERDDALDRLVRLLRWTEKEQEKAWNQWVKKLPNKDAPKSHFLIARSETMREVARKIKREMRGLSLPNDPAMASAATMEPENQQTPKNDE